MKQNPLWMPEGSVRAILALTIVAAAIAGVFTLPAEASGLLLALAGTVTAFYFKVRENS